MSPTWEHDRTSSTLAAEGAAVKVSVRHSNRQKQPWRGSAVGAVVTFVVAFGISFLWLASDSLWVHLFKATIVALVCASLVAKWGDAAVGLAIRILWHSR